MNKTVFIVIDLTPDFNFFPRNLTSYKPTPRNFNNSFTLNFSVYTRSYMVDSKSKIAVGKFLGTKEMKNRVSSA